MSWWQKLIHFIRSLFGGQLFTQIPVVNGNHYGLKQEEVEEHIKDMIKHPELLCQTHYTDFCGFYSFSYCYINENPQGFEQFIKSLYNTGVTNKGSNQYPVTQEIAEAITRGLKADLKQNWGILDSKLPHSVEMLYMLTLANIFSILPFYYKPYSNEAHLENDALWSGMSMASQERLFHEFGFTTEVIGNDFVETTVFPFDEAERSIVLQAITKNHTYVCMLVNSWRMIAGCTDAYPDNYIPRPEPEFPQNGAIGTHWILLQEYSIHNCKFWDYGSAQGRNYSGDLLDVTAGFIIAKYNPKTT